MKIISDISKLREEIKKEKFSNKKIGFVPTMGTLHDGHLSLVKMAKKNSDFIVVSIFVNPTQFGDKEDLDKYPRDLESDAKKLEKLGVNLIFAPTEKEIYTEGYQTVISVTQVSKGLCGDKRAGHFEGVATIVTKLFNIVTPDIAFFGQKDYQQLQLITRMVTDLNMDIKIKSVPIKRESDGLAMSSRNLRLSKAGRKKAALLNKELKAVIKKYKDGEKDANKIVDIVKSRLEESGIEIDYVEIRDNNTLASKVEIDDNSRIFIAAFVENIRLIDNIPFKENL